MEKNKMGYVPIPKLIPQMALPLIFSMLVQALYNVVDSIFVSRISESALTALSLAAPVQMIVVAVFVGMSVGVSSAIARKLGAKDHEGATLVAENGVILSTALYAVVALFGAFGVKFIFSGYTDSAEIIEYAITYTRIVLIFSFGSILNQAGRSIFRGTGDMIKPMIAQLIGAITNIILDPIFIFGYLGVPAMGVKGAAVATVTAQIIAMIYIWIQIILGKSILKVTLSKLKVNFAIIKDILVVGIPTFVMQSLGSVMLFFMNFILAGFGDSAIAVLGVYFRVQSMVFMPLFGLASSTMPVVGFNYGAKDRKRMKDAVWFSSKAALVFMVLCFIAFQLLAKQILLLFNASDALMQIGIPAFRTISYAFPLVSITIVLSTAFQGLKKAHYSLIISLIRTIIVLLPVAWLLASLNNVDLVWFAFPIAEIVGVTVTIIMFIKTFRNCTKSFS